MTWFVLIAAGLLSVTAGQLVTKPTGRIVLLVLGCVLFGLAALIAFFGPVALTG